MLSFELPKVMMSSPRKKLSLKEAKRKTSFTLKPDSLLVGLQEAGAGKLMGRVTSQTHVTRQVCMLLAVLRIEGAHGIEEVGSPYHG